MKMLKIQAIIIASAMFVQSSCHDDSSNNAFVPTAESCQGERCLTPECADFDCDIDDIDDIDIAPQCEGDKCPPIYESCTQKCESWQECIENTCIDKPCDPACLEGQECIQGVCTPELCGGEICSETQACFKDACHDISEFCGHEICTSEQKCDVDHCIELDACDITICPEGQACVLSENKLAKCYAESCFDGELLKDCSEGRVCVDGECIEHAFEEADSCDGGYLNSYGECIIPLKSISIVANGVETDNVEVMLKSTVSLSVKYEPENTTQKGVIWTTTNITPEDNKKDVKQFLEITGEDSDEITMNGISFFAGEIDLRATSSVNPIVSATAKVLVKPYYALRPGDVYNDHATYRKKNLACKQYNEYNQSVFNRDLYEKFVQPKMIAREEDGETVYYPTRASVVAAARFLSMQFPYNFPYRMESIKDYTMRSHYVWSTSKEAENAEDIRVYGLNLTGNVYNSHTEENKIATATPWACNLPSGDKAGLECSGYVTWSLRNGRFHCGDWKTAMFDGTTFQKPEKVNTTSSTMNINNKLDNTIEKFAKLDKDVDFIKVKDIKDDQIHAGDLLWHGGFKQDDGSSGSGHIAMVVGVKRKAEDNTVEYVYVSEAAAYGNGMTRYAGLSKLRSSPWGETKKYYCYLIRMDNVYSYYSDNYGLDESTNAYDDFW